MNANETFMELLRLMGIDTKDCTAVDIKLRPGMVPVITVQCLATKPNGTAPAIETAQYEVKRVR